ncbi:MAG: AEC family transporter [Oscillospiraceae bacterium]|nr:AEC family transporter [Oscillospiraceae bacterium]
MESLLVCFRAVVPIFLMMALGYLAQRLGAIRREDVPRMNKIAFRFFLSITLFYSIYKSDISRAVQPKLLLFSVAAVLVEFALAAGFVLLTEKEPEKRGVKIQGLFRSNFVLIGLPLTEALAEGKDIGPVALLIAVVVSLFNAMAVVTLEAFRGNRPPVGKILGNILINPLIIASALGLLFLLTPLRLGTVLESTVRQISGVANPFMLFLLGAFFRFDGLRRYWRDLLEVSIGRLVIIPGVFLTAAWLLGFRGVAFAGLIPMLGSATAVSSFTMVQQLGGDDELAGDIVVITSALCVVTLFFWSFLFKTLGAF